MRQERIMVMVALLVFIFAHPVLAAGPGNDKARPETGSSGFSGRIYIGGIWMDTKSNLNPGDDNKRLNTLDQDAKSESEFSLMAFFELEYHSGDGHKLYVGIPFEDEPRFTLGVLFEAPHGGEFDISLFYGLPGEVWEDPYLIGVDRKITDENRYGGKFAYELGDWEIGYELELVDVDKDEIGLRLPDLKRDGTIHRFESGYEIELGHGIELLPSLEFTLADIDGKSNKHQGFVGTLRLMKTWPDFQLMVSLEAGVNEFDTIHPVFNKTRRGQSVCIHGRPVLAQSHGL